MPPRRKARKPKRSIFKAFLIRLLVLSLIFALVIAGLWLYRLDRMVVAQFEGRKWAVPAHVFARPQEIYSGLKLDRPAFIELLQHLGYRQLHKLDRAASFAVHDNFVDLITRAYQNFDQVQESLALRVEFAPDRVRRISTLADAQPVSEFTLQPQLIGSLRPGQHEDRDLISIQEVPPQFIHTLLATEDRKFLSHHGVDFLGIARAMVVNLRAGRFVQGGSTITQQLVKNFYLTSERTIKRKLKEMVMAGLLELHYDKHKILETYLNEVYLGQAGNRAIHGFQLASKFYFGRPLNELEAQEAALLVGLAKGASRYNPFRNPERALNRRNVVLKIMLNEQNLTEAQYEYLAALPLGVTQNDLLRKSAYPAYLDLVRRQLNQQYEEDALQTEGMVIYTSMDLTIQQAADKALTEVIEAIESERQLEQGKLQGAMVVVRVGSGEILALSADRQSGFSGFNRALDARRSIGSLAKPAVFLTALEQSDRYTLMSRVADSPLTVVSDAGQRWSPGNYDNKFHGDVTLVDALARSYNIPTVRVGMEVGVDEVVTTMQRLGLSSEIKPYPSSLLGASQHTPLEMAQMYQTLANDGFQAPLRGILSVQSADHQPLDRYPLYSQQVTSSAASHLLDYALKQVVKRGTAKRLASAFPSDYAIAGKTGTTNDYRDSWFAGYSGDLLAVVWLGRDDNQSMGLTGASGAMRVWQQLFSQLRLRQWPSPPPPDVNYLSVNPVNGLRTESDCETAINVPFRLGTEPSGFQSCHQPVRINAPEIASKTVKQPQRQETVVKEVKDWFERLFGGGSSEQNTNSQRK